MPSEKKKHQECEGIRDIDVPGVVDVRRFFAVESLRRGSGEQPLEECDRIADVGFTIGRSILPSAATSDVAAAEGGGEGDLDATVTEKPRLGELSAVRYSNDRWGRVGGRHVIVHEPNRGTGLVWVFGDFEARSC